MGVLGMSIFDYLFFPGSGLYSVGALSFGLNWIYRVYSYMGFAITRIDLNEDGKSVKATLKTGGTINIKIKDIVKKQHEKELV